MKDRVFERADKFEERQKEKAAQLDKNEYTGKEQSMKQPKAKNMRWNYRSVEYRITIKWESLISHGCMGDF